jgi:hypothetical protein
MSAPEKVNQTILGDGLGTERGRSIQGLALRLENSAKSFYRFFKKPLRRGDQ